MVRASRRRPVMAALVACGVAVHARVAPAQVRVSAAAAAQRPHGHPPPGSLDADRARAALVSRRLQGREAGPHRLRPPLRAPDVQGLARTSSPSSTRRSSPRSAARPTPTPTRTRRCSGRRCRRSTCRWCCGWRPTGWPRCASTRRRSSREREVVKEERRMRIENQPFGRLNEIIYEQAFTTHPYKHPVIGSMEDLERGHHRRRARLLRHLLHAGERHRGDRRRLRRPRPTIGLVNQYFGRVPRR